MIALMALALATTLAAAPAAAPTLGLYPERFYRGTPETVTADRPDLALKFRPASVRTVGRWQVCSEPEYQGHCIDLARDHPVEAGLGQNFAIRSVRLLAEGSGANDPAPGVLPGGPSLAGTRTRYFPRPLYGSERVLACPAKVDDGGMGCAKDTAGDLCRRAGYRRLEHLALEDVGGRMFLADVLCSKEQ